MAQTELDEAFKYARVCIDLCTQQRPPHKSGWYTPWDVILKALFPLGERYTAVCGITLVSADRTVSKTLRSDFTVQETYPRERRARVAIMIVDIHNAGYEKELGVQKLIEHLSTLASNFMIPGQTYCYGILAIGPEWIVYRKDVASGSEEVFMDWMDDFASDASRDAFDALKKEVVPVVEHAKVLSAAAAASAGAGAERV